MAGPAMNDRQVREIDDGSRYAVAQEGSMENLIDKVDSMGSLRLRWDSKVPNKDRTWYNFASFKKSDPEVMKKEIEKYKDFYADMKSAIRQVRDGDEDAEELIDDLYENLLNLKKEAESEIDSDDSTTLCKLHQEFIEKHELLENKIKRVEVVAVRQQLRRVRDDWRNAMNDITRVTQEMQRAREDNEDLRQRFERLIIVNEQLVAQQEQVNQENSVIRTLLERLVGGSGR